MSFKLYDVEGYGEPLAISDEHAQQIGAKPHEPGAPTKGGPTKADLQAEAERLGLPVSGTKAELAERIAEASAPPADGPEVQ